MITVDITWMVCDPGGLCCCVSVRVCVCYECQYWRSLFWEFWVPMEHKYSECLTCWVQCVCGDLQQQLRGLERVVRFGNCSLPTIPAGLGSYEMKQMTCAPVP